MDTQYETLKVLVADDVAAHRHLLGAILETLQVKPDLVCDGAAAAAAAEETAYDLILLDVSMPVMDGLEAGRRIRAHERARGGRRTAIFMVTSHTDPLDVLASREAGADGHIAKPLRVAPVLEAIHYAARRRPNPTGFAGFIHSKAA
jgi:CheY-like chemotaxis protein